MTAFDSAFAQVLKEEGGYVNDPADPGGATKYGITQTVARANGYEGGMAALPFATAKDIYRAKYWDVLEGDAVAAVSPAIAGKLFDIGVNAGASEAALFLQRALNALNRGGRDYRGVNEDGGIGPVTLGALAALHEARGAAGMNAMLKLLNVQAGSHYMEIVRANPGQAKYMFGWIEKRLT